MFAFDNDPDPDARCRRYRIAGRLDAGRFERFLRARATLLSLHVAAVETRSGRVDAIVQGDPALLGMFEMACAVGPGDCIVDDMTHASCPSPQSLKR